MPIQIFAISAEKPALIPTPQAVKWSNRSSLVKTIKIVSKVENPSKDYRFTMQRLLKLFADNKLRKGNDYRVVVKLGKVDAPYQKDEAYMLKTTAREAIITANSETGIFYGIATLRQLMTRSKGKTRIAHCEITDYPAFKIRGYMHDVGRNFISLDMLKKQVDLMSHYKYNIFHWHLSDHHGWRLESKIYPNLQADSSFQRFTGKFYTQKEFVEFVKYCRQRKITVIPELDSPGHSCAFRAGVGVKNMKDPKAKEAICQLIDELCSLVPAEHMPYIHLGTDEVRHRDEFVNSDYLPALFAAVKKNKREIIGWWKGMSVKGDTSQIQQTWAQFSPRSNLRHIDSRSNYVNHLYHLNFLSRILFQQPCRQPHGDEMNLGGILCYWPDTYAPDEKQSMINSPVWQSMVAYPEAVWTGVKKDINKYWAMIPPKNSDEGKMYAEMENRLIEHRNRFLRDIPFYFVKNSHIPWKLLGPIETKDLTNIGTKPIQKTYKENGKEFNWGDDVYGGTIELRQPFGFGGHYRSAPSNKDKAYAFTKIYSPKKQNVDFWISFNTVSTSDDRAGRAVKGQWNRNKHCNIWVNGKAIPAPNWKSDGKSSKENPIVDEPFTARPPTTISLNKGWNQVMICVGKSYKWHFTFCPVKVNGTNVQEVKGLKFSTEIK